LSYGQFYIITQKEKRNLQTSQLILKKKGRKISNMMKKKERKVFQN